MLPMPTAKAMLAPPRHTAGSRSCGRVVPGRVGRKWGADGSKRLGQWVPLIAGQYASQEDDHGVGNAKTCRDLVP